MTRRTVVILQHRLLHYRVKLFERLRQVCAERDIDLELVHGQASPREAAKRDEGHLPWAHAVRNRFLAIGDRDLLWQPFPAMLQEADLLIVMQENRIVSNYPHMLSRRLRGRPVAYWGHGKNFQSEAPDGLRERWKNMLLRQVDWWFTYTELSVSVIRDAGYPAERITSLENAIDTTGFLNDLQVCTDDDIAQARHNLGIPANARIGLFCGSLYPEKKLSLMVEAARQIQARMPAFHLLVIGDGPSMPELRSAAAEHSWIHVLGIRKGREKALHFRMAHIMFNPGLVGLHIVDAFCAGLIIATTATAHHSPEIAYLRPGDNGIMVDSEEPRCYADAVLEVLASPERLAAMRAASLRDSTRYSLENMVERFAIGIEQALGPVNATEVPRPRVPRR